MERQTNQEAPICLYFNERRINQLFRYLKDNPMHKNLCGFAFERDTENPGFWFVTITPMPNVTFHEIYLTIKLITYE